MHRCTFSVASTHRDINIQLYSCVFRFVYYSMSLPVRPLERKRKGVRWAFKLENKKIFSPRLIVVLARTDTDTHRHTHSRAHAIQKPHKKWKRNLRIFSCKYWAISSGQTRSCVYSGSWSQPVCHPRIAPKQVIHNRAAPLCYYEAPGYYWPFFFSLY